VSEVGARRCAFVSPSPSSPPPLPLPPPPSITTTTASPRVCLGNLFYQASGIGPAVDAHNGIGFDYDTLSVYDWYVYMYVGPYQS
jgi:hypothetical protein